MNTFLRVEGWGNGCDMHCNTLQERLAKLLNRILETISFSFKTNHINYKKDIVLSWLLNYNFVFLKYFCIFCISFLFIGGATAFSLFPDLGRRSGYEGYNIFSGPRPQVPMPPSSMSLSQISPLPMRPSFNGAGFPGSSKLLFGTTGIRNQDMFRLKKTITCL